MGRVDRHVGGTGLEHGQQADQGVQAALGDHRHAPVRLGTQARQVLGQRVGAAVELAVAQALAILKRCQGLRRGLGLGLDTTMNQRLAIVGPSLRRGIPLPQAGVLAGGQQVKGRDTLLRLFQALLKDVQQALGQRRSVLFTEPGAVVHQVQASAVTLAVAAQVNAQRGGFMAIANHHGVARHVTETQVVAILFERHHQFEQLWPFFTQCAEAAVEFAEGETLVAEVLLERIAYPLHQRREGALAAKVHAQRADLGKQPQGRLELRVAAVAHRQTDHPLVTLPGACAAHMQGGQQYMKWRGLQRASQRSHTCQQTGIEWLFEHCAGRRKVYRVTLARRQQGVRQLLVFSQPIIAVAVVPWRTLVLGIVLDERPIGRCAARQGQPLFEQVVVFGDLLEPLVHPPTVEDQVVGLYGKQVALLAQANQCGAPKRAGIQAIGRLHPGLQQGLGCRPRRLCIAHIVPHQFHFQGGGKVLPRHPPLCHQHSTQAVMLGNQVRQCLAQPRGIHPAVHFDIGADVVQRRVAVADLVQPDVALGNAQGKGFGGRHESAGPSD
ncbi:hypothetical protein D3C76_204830 [compost metagenome]